MLTLITALARSLVDDESSVDVKEIRSDRTAVYEISVADAEYGKLIGTHGAHIKALRVLLASAGRKSGLNVVVEVNDPKHRRQ
jgi:predicted RNA-binding protein YlqC (UPF0109 family)